MSSKRSQAIITSHSPSILRRIEPQEIRYFRINETREAIVKSLVLPDGVDEAYKYVNESIRAYPELLFSKLVILGEGDSEQIVVPRVAKASGIDIDLSFVSFVPLGGRHVNHFWRLLSQLGIPYVTLLDFDRGRTGGASGRIKYVMKQLLAIGADKESVLGGLLTEERLERFHSEVLSKTTEERFTRHLLKFRVLFSYPLDLDFMMLSHFFDEYTVLDGGEIGPAIPESSDINYLTRCKSAVAAVLKKDLPGDVNMREIPQVELYFWYRYLFLGRGKPASHIRATVNLSDQRILEHSPAVLVRLANLIKAELGAAQVTT